MMSAPTSTNSTNPAVAPGPDHASAAARRRSGRKSKELPIVLSGSDTGGRQFSEKTKTLVLSRHGASVLSRYKMIPEQEIFLLAVETKREVEVRVCGQIGESADGYIYGVAFIDPTVNFWDVDFSPADSSEKDLSRVALECTGCRQRAVVDFDATEMDVYLVNEGSLRYCKRCLNSTTWKITTEPATPEVLAAPTQEGAAPGTKETNPEPQPPPAPSTVTQPNRRKDRRTKVKFHACIRCSGRDDEIVACEDVSRGGFSFRSSREYPEETLIEVALPYTPGQEPIFLAAQIANTRKLQAAKTYRYGAAYLRSPKNKNTW
jgi:PilZ domain